MRNAIWMLGLSLCAGAVSAQTTPCYLGSYKAIPGLTAALRAGVVTFEWSGERGRDLRAAFGVHQGQPVVEELAVRNGGRWSVLARDLSPEFQVTTGVRRLSEQQAAPLRGLRIALTPEVVEREKWNAFWDAPLIVPGAGSLSLPRKAEEIRRDWATFRVAGCSVKTDGARLELTYPGVDMGIFSGVLRYTVYRGTNLLRQEIIAKTAAPSVAYKYLAGLKGFAAGDATRLVWRDPARTWQEYSLDGPPNTDPVALRARNRVGVVENADGSIAFFPPSHKFAFAREIETNLGFIYYRKTGGNAFAIGVRQADREEPYKPYGVSEEEWEKRAHEARHDIDNFALYNAPPGTLQRMPVYFYLDAAGGRATAEAVLAFTHGDVYKPMPGFKVMASHFHMHFNEQLSDAGTLDLRPPWIDVFRGLGVDIVNLADFHSDSHPKDPGPIRFQEQRVYFEGCRRLSGGGFLLIPGEEPDDNFGGHYISIMPRPVYWSQTRASGQTFHERDPQYGDVYHVGSAGDELTMLREMNGFMWQAHPRTKGSAGYPDAVRDEPHFLSDRFLGASYQSLPVDQSEKRLCERRCLGLMDEMNNWTGPKYLIAEGDTYMKYPDDETFPQLIVNYVKLGRVPRFDAGWDPLLAALRAGDFYVSSGEVLFRDWAIEGSGSRRVDRAGAEWTFPLEFAELVWGDGQSVHTQIVAAAGLPPFGSKTFRIPFDPAGKKWVRFAVWDSAGNGAFTQPVHLR